ncbi:MAG TPA: hypothetical protein VKI18_13240 [Albitalea sp.]|nr:hypothetical protein [Albitalea sp.]
MGLLSALNLKPPPGWKSQPLPADRPGGGSALDEGHAELRTTIDQQVAAAKSRAQSDLASMIPVLTGLIAEPMQFVLDIRLQLESLLDEVRVGLHGALADSSADQFAQRAGNLRASISKDHRLLALDKAAPILGVDMNASAAFGKVFDDVSRTAAATLK